MKIDKEVYRYIEYELYHYEFYKKELLLEREKIIESTASSAIDGMPRGNKISNIPLDKVIMMNESTAVLSLQRRIGAIDTTLAGLTDIHKKIFDKFYCKRRNDIYRMCDEIGISYETFKRYRQKIILGVGNELGIVKLS